MMRNVVIYISLSAAFLLFHSRDRNKSPNTYHNTHTSSLYGEISLPSPINYYMPSISNLTLFRYTRSIDTVPYTRCGQRRILHKKFEKDDYNTGVFKQSGSEKIDIVLTVPYGNNISLPSIQSLPPKGTVFLIKPSLVTTPVSILKHVNKLCRVRSILASALRDLKFQVHEEIQCTSSTGSIRRVDIIAINRKRNQAVVLDPTVRFEINIDRAKEVDLNTIRKYQESEGSKDDNCDCVELRKHLVLVTDPEGAGDQYAFDNPCFKGMAFTTLKFTGTFFFPQVVAIREDVQNVHLLLEYRPHIDVSLTCEHDPKLQEYCVYPQNMPQFDSEGIPNQAPETNKPMILNGPTSRNREGSDQVSVEAKQLGHLYLSIDQETFDPSTGEPYDCSVQERHHARSECVDD
ncbi:hypothetical protein ANN_04024 [Periplaneta americana]|uniref:Uncharacterized protein n=1 Tax=Periplaneta americana TaxID=6978 RepID=A0ABQ8T7F4_PERAM|nr:hypothetical protein ANN_04024 [Periplaneta americana]